MGAVRLTRLRREPDSGASAIEYGALLALVTALVAVLLSSMLPVFSTETKTKICQVFQGGACKTTIQAPGGTAAKPGQHTDANGRRVDANGRPVDANGQPFPVDAAGRPLGPDGKPLGIDSNGRPVDSSGRPVDANGRPLGPDGRPLGPDGRPVDANGQPVATSGQPVTADPNKWGPNWQQNYAGFTTPWDRFWAPINKSVNGFFDGLQRGIKEGVQGLLGGIWSDVKGVVEPFIHPIETVKGLWWAVQHPKEAAISLVWDDESKKDWDSGHKVRAVTRAGWNVGSWFIPYYDIAKAVSKIGKFNKIAKAAEAAGKLESAVSDASKTAKAAEGAAKAGDIGKYRKLLDDLQQKLRRVDEETKGKHCPVSLGPPPTPQTRRPAAAVAGSAPGTPALARNLPFGAFTWANGPPRSDALALRPLALLRVLPGRARDCGDVARTVQDLKNALKPRLTALGLTEAEADALLQALRAARESTDKLHSFDDLIEILKRGDLKPPKAKALQDALKSAGRLAATGRVDEKSLAKSIERMREYALSEGSIAARIQEVDFEIRNALDALDKMPVYPGTKVILNVDKNTVADLGRGRVDTSPVDEVDVLYMTTRTPGRAPGSVNQPPVLHMDDTKATWSAAKDKILKALPGEDGAEPKPSQVTKMGEWARKNPEQRQATYHVPDKTDLESLFKDEESVKAFNLLAKHGVGLRINGRYYSPGDIKKAVQQGTFKGVPGKPEF
ncbi:Flp family type IVb pilin [Spirillospora sp. NPDC050679]